MHGEVGNERPIAERRLSAGVEDLVIVPLVVIALAVSKLLKAVLSILIYVLDYAFPILLQLMRVPLLTARLIGDGMELLLEGVLWCLPVSGAKRDACRARPRSHRERRRRRRPRQDGEEFSRDGEARRQALSRPVAVDRAADPEVKRAADLMLSFNGRYEDLDRDGKYDNPGLTLFRQWLQTAPQVIFDPDLGEWWSKIDADRYLKYQTSLLLRALQGRAAGLPLKVDYFKGRDRDRVRDNGEGDTPG